MQSVVMNIVMFEEIKHHGSCRCCIFISVSQLFSWIRHNVHITQTMQQHTANTEN